MKPSETLSQCWTAIQGNLFPWLQEALGPLSEKQQQPMSILECTRVEQWIPSCQRFVGRPQDNRCAIARAFIAKAVYRPKGE